MTNGAAGADLVADLGSAAFVEIMPNHSYMFNTGTAIQLPEGMAGLLIPRSSLCNKKGLKLVNSVGLLDEDYTGNIKFCYENTGPLPVIIEHGERIGQILVVPYIKANFQKVDKLEETERGNGGFGSTGAK